MPSYNSRLFDGPASSARARSIRVLKRIFFSLPLVVQVGLARTLYSTGILGEYFSAFNGQRRRRSVFLNILKLIDFWRIVETGTFRGSTTQFFAEHFSDEIISVEMNHQFYKFAQLRLARFSHVNVVHDDSISYLERCANDEAPLGATLFYLDAHWYDYLPLLDELRLIFEHWPNSIIIIDDFATPDVGFRYDDYGAGKVLSLSYLAPLKQRDFDIFFPAFSSSEETGAQTGFVILTTDRQLSRALADIPGIKHYGGSCEMIPLRPMPDGGAR